MKRVDVVKENDRWVAKQKGRVVHRLGRLRDDAVRKMARIAKRDRDAVTVRVHAVATGRIREERTYPRKADPKRRRG